VRILVGDAHAAAVGPELCNTGGSGKTHPVLLGHDGASVERDGHGVPSLDVEEAEHSELEPTRGRVMAARAAHSKSAERVLELEEGTPEPQVESEAKQEGLKPESVASQTQVPFRSILLRLVPHLPD